jgi:hypothetical protein
VVLIERIRELIRLGNENQNLDYKGPFSWTEASPDEKCDIVKDVLAFSNARDGGVILIGVEDKTGVLQGLTEEQAASFDQTKFNDLLQRYTDPRHTASVHRLTIDGKRLVVIDIPEFADVPILCARDANSSTNSKKLILRRACIYKRTEKATSEPVEDADGMRELLNRGLLRRQDELLRAFKQIIQPSLLAAAQKPGAEFKAEAEKAEHYFSELEKGEFAQLPHWDVLMHPETYLANRIPTSAALQQLVQKSAVSLRGWTFPIAGRIQGADWTNFEHGSQSFFPGRGDRPEALRAYRSGLVTWLAGLGEDHWQGLEGQNLISFVSVIYSVTEWMLFATRFYESVVAVEEGISVTLRATGIKGRKLASLYPGINLSAQYKTEVDSFELIEAVAMADLRADPEALARRIIRRIFELFNWNDPDENMLRDWQQKLIQRTY